MAKSNFNVAYRYLLDEADAFLTALHQQKQAEAIRIGCGLFSRFVADLGRDSELRQAIEHASHKLHNESKEAIAFALQSFVDEEIKAFQRAGAKPYLVESIKHHASYAELYLQNVPINLDLVYSHVLQLKEAVCAIVHDLKNNGTEKQVLRKGKDVATGGAVLYVNLSGDFLGGSGVLSLISSGVGSGIIARALGLPGFKWPGGSGKSGDE